jgi:thiamine-monophosphate kinase
LNEERIVQGFLRALTGEVPEALGLTDDCAVAAPPPGESFVFKTDAVVAGTHFFADDTAADIGYKALAVAVSDLVAKAAQPRFWQLALALPAPPNEAWLGQLCQGFAEVQDSSGIRLIGGDLVRTSGPLMLSVTAIGTVPTGKMLRRGGAQAGDHVYVSGTIGDAALGLAVRRADAVERWALTAGAREQLRVRYLRPELRLGLIPALGRYATAGMDVSDGLLLDFSRLCRAGGLGGVLDLDRVPLSEPVHAAAEGDEGAFETAVTGGDDYEVLAAVPASLAAEFEQAAKQCGVLVTSIGEVRSKLEIEITGRRRTLAASASHGYQHFDTVTAG